MTRWMGTPCSSIRSKNHARVEGRAFDGREQLVLRGVSQLPAERDAAEFRIHQHRAVAVVPGQAQQARSRRRGTCSSPPDSAATVVPARLAMASKMSPVADSPASTPASCG